MARRIRWSILSKVSIAITCAIAVSPAWAQHPSHMVGGGTRPAPPPVSRAPVFHAPVTYAPISSPRFAAGALSGFSGTAGFRPVWRPIRPFPPVIIVYYPLAVGPPPLWRYDSCWWASCELFWTLGSVVAPYYPYSAPNYAVTPQYEAPPVYGEVSADLPQLYLSDGSILSVTDYWVVDGRLHFTMIEEEGAKPVEHDVPFEALDLQKTVDANTRRGFNFMLRNEPFEQYVRDHPDAPPADTTPPHN